MLDTVSGVREVKEGVWLNSGPREARGWAGVPSTALGLPQTPQVPQGPCLTLGSVFCSKLKPQSHKTKRG